MKKISVDIPEKHWKIILENTKKEGFSQSDMVRKIFKMYVENKLVPVELLKFMSNLFNKFSIYLMSNPEISAVISLNEEKLRKIEELIK